LASFFAENDSYLAQVSLSALSGSEFYYQSGVDQVLEIQTKITLGEVPGDFSIYRVGLADAIDGVKPVVYGLSPSVSAGKLSMAMNSANKIDLSNLQNLVDGSVTTGVSPRLHLVMDGVPASGDEGSMTLNIMLLEGDDG